MSEAKENQEKLSPQQILYLQRSLANRYEHYFKVLKDTDRTGNKTEYMLFHTGYNQTKIDPWRLDQKDPYNKLKNSLSDNLALFTARLSGWSQEQIQNSINEGRKFASDEAKLYGQTQQMAVQAWIFVRKQKEGKFWK